MKKLSLMDASWLTLESKETPMHVATLQVFNLPEDADADFLQDVVSRFRHADEFDAPFNLRLNKPDATLPAWVEDKEIDLDYHLRHSALPQPGGRAELFALVSRLHASLMDRTRPLWEVHVIEGLEGGKFAIYAKIHHSLVDGVAGMKLMQASYTEDADKRGMLPPWAKGARPSRQKRKKEDLAFSDMLMQVFTALKAQATSVPGLVQTAKDMIDVARQSTGQGSGVIPYQTPKSVLNQRVSAQRRFSAQSFPIDRIKALAKKTNATLNDIVMAMCAGMLRSYLIDVNQLPSKPLIADVPVSVRPQGQEAGNAISVILATLATNEADPAKRLNLIKESMKRGKEQLNRMSAAEIMNYTTLVMLPFTIGQIIGTAGRIRPMFNVVISNVPGPKKPLYFDGAVMEAFYPVSLIFNGQAMNVTITSYVDSLDFGFTGCRKLVPEIDQFPRYLTQAFDDLEAATQ